MSRVAEALMFSEAFAKNAPHSMLDVTKGGQMGYAPNLTEWVSNQAYIRRNLICILLEAPRFFDYMPNPEKWVQSLKALVELHPRTIEGFNAGLTVEFDEHPVGGAGEMQQEITDVKRARSEPVFTFVEKYGMPIQTFLYNWITYGMQDPDTKFALAGTLENVPDDMLADWFTMSCLFIEPDPTHKYVQKSWVTTNMMPKGTGEIIGKRDLTVASEITTLSIEFTGISQFNMGTNILAQEILNSINLTNANPYLRPAFVDGVSKTVLAATRGYREGIATMAETATSYEEGDGSGGAGGATGSGVSTPASPPPEPPSAD